MRSNSANIVVVSGSIQNDVGRASGDVVYRVGEVAWPICRLCNFGHIVYSSDEIEGESVAHSESFPRSPSGVVRVRARGNPPTKVVPDDMSVILVNLVRNILKTRLYYQTYPIIYTF